MFQQHQHPSLGQSRNLLQTLMSLGAYRPTPFSIGCWAEAAVWYHIQDVWPLLSVLDETTEQRHNGSATTACTAASTPRT